MWSFAKKVFMPVIRSPEWLTGVGGGAGLTGAGLGAAATAGGAGFGGSAFGAAGGAGLGAGAAVPPGPPRLIG
jgi:hypothetical protein